MRGEADEVDRLEWQICEGHGMRSARPSPFLGRLGLAQHLLRRSGERAASQKLSPGSARARGVIGDGAQGLLAAQRTGRDRRSAA